MSHTRTPSQYQGGAKARPIIVIRRRKCHSSSEANSSFAQHGCMHVLFKQHGCLHVCYACRLRNCAVWCRHPENPACPSLGLVRCTKARASFGVALACDVTCNYCLPPPQRLSVHTGIYRDDVNNNCSRFLEICLKQKS